MNMIGLAMVEQKKFTSNMKKLSRAAATMPTRDEQQIQRPSTRISST